MWLNTENICYQFIKSSAFTVTFIMYRWHVHLPSSWLSKECRCVKESTFIVIVVNSHQCLAKSNNWSEKAVKPEWIKCTLVQKAESTTLNPLHCLPSRLSVFCFFLFSFPFPLRMFRGCRFERELEVQGLFAKQENATWMLTRKSRWQEKWGGKKQQCLHLKTLALE